MKSNLFFFLSLFMTGVLLAQVSKSATCTAGGLSGLITETGKNTIKSLTLTGTVGARDFKTMRDDMIVLAVLDISAIISTSYTGKESL